jgi:ABC-type Fe3+-siderophore transport system permease subunit
MANPYYTPTGNPPNQTRGTSALVRNEFDSIEAGFDDVYAEILALAAAIGVAVTVSEVPLASASTTDIGNGYGPALLITGSNPINSFGANYKGGIFLRFQGSLQINHSAALQCPGGQNITTQADDACIAVPIGDPANGWRIMAYCRVSQGIIDDIAVKTSSTYANPSWLTSLAWSKITGRPTTLAGYGITDAPQKDGTGATGTWPISVSGSSGSVTGQTATGTALIQAADAGAARSAISAAASGSNADIVSLSALAAINGGQLAGLRNIIINGGIRINQRQSASNADDTYAHDRWYVLTQSGAIAVSTLSDVENGTPSMARLTQSQAGAQRMGYAQIVEGRDCKHLRGKQVTFRFGRMRLSASANVRVAVLEWTGTEDTVTSDVVNDWTSANYTAGNFFIGSNLTVSGVVQQAMAANTLTDGEEVTVTLGSSFNNLIVFAWTEGTVAQNVTLDLAKAQLEIGGVATPFEHIPLAQEFSMCLRYYERLAGRVTTAIASFFVAYGWKTSKRVTPTMSVIPDIGSGAAATAVGTESFYQNANNSDVTSAIYVGSAEL